MGIGDDTNDDTDVCLMTVTCFYVDDLAIVHVHNNDNYTAIRIHIHISSVWLSALASSSGFKPLALGSGFWFRFLASGSGFWFEVSGFQLSVTSFWPLASGFQAQNTIIRKFFWYVNKHNFLCIMCSNVRFNL